ncbi:kinase-like domain-containing protein [Favolaschia claudopus]|uniref:Kinase-like domain-containing protein n=1 Tax=Favolaschia claudopus TaxID=2862362 RepID=A0AAW0DTC4_9AGAR
MRPQPLPVLPRTLGGKIVVHQFLLAFVGGALDTQHPHQVAQLRLDLDECLSLACYDAVTTIAQSVQVRRVLLEIVSKLGLTNDPNLRVALRSDRERIASLLVTSLQSENDRDTMLNLSGDLAQCFLDVVQETLDKRLLQDAEHRMARSMVRRLSEASGSLPSSLFIPSAVCTRETYPTDGGGFGDIYRAFIDGKPVALKRMRQFLHGSDLRRIHLKFCREALIWKDLHHPYILPLIGIDRDSFPDFLCMVSPWMEHGTVIDFLKKHGHDIVDKLLYETAQGLEYLHSRNIVHGDLKGANILIQEDWTACLADFGLSKFSDASTSMSSNRGGTVYWMAPELLDPVQLEDSFIRTPASDIYAFGCVCFELYTGRPPFANVLDIIAANKIIAGERPLRPLSSPAMSDALWEHVKLYWGQSPSSRPTTQQAVGNMCYHISLPFTPLVEDSTDAHGTSLFFPNTTYGIHEICVTYGITPAHDQSIQPPISQPQNSAYVPVPPYTSGQDDDGQREIHMGESPSSPEGGSTIRSLHGNYTFPLVHRFSLLKRGAKPRKNSNGTVSPTGNGGNGESAGWNPLDSLFSSGPLVAKCDICSKRLGRQPVLECDDCKLRAHIKCGEVAPRDCGVRPSRPGTHQSPLSVLSSPLSKVRQNAAAAAASGGKSKASSPSQ